MQPLQRSDDCHASTSALSVLMSVLSVLMSACTVCPDVCAVCPDVCAVRPDVCAVRPERCSHHRGPMTALRPYLREKKGGRTPILDLTLLELESGHWSKFDRHC
ncbi:hypothetical protein NDU88_001195 [Pleurodeles waltl]|uniref:Secreted protein n=1 Tax=Pleurodeles waltl TaxID=8319 RepID=A0AAV7V9F8_PLEWA|nr:hypothetical protein NDU88_001195 [Pleurodeles waltl]